jgi:large subunit ribosomal protein L29
MKTSDLRAKDAAGLEKEVSELLKAHFGLRMQKATQQLTNHSQLKNTRRDIARAKTIQTEQKRAATSGTTDVAAKKTGAKK